ncbi:uncharacterized protein LOC143336189 isoform X2 [Chaetodon auriga]|uniref:uncharacterized protein LOC143336189 isoform X2 n=1 Tax=Chaetodon auriga TaxID=39042 RepID=UPI004032D8DC
MLVVTSVRESPASPVTEHADVKVVSHCPVERLDGVHTCDVYSGKVQLFTFSPQCPAAVTAQRNLFLTVRGGDGVTLPCESVINDQRECNSTTWLLSGSTVVPLFEHGQIHSEAAAEAHRLSLAADCSLVIKTVSAEDAGSYTCRQFRSGQQGPGSQVHLSVTTLTEHEGTDEVTFSCSVRPFGECRHTVRWLIVNEGVKKGAKASWSTCSAYVTFEASLFRNIKDFLKCNVTDGYSGKVHVFAFQPQSSGQDAGEDTIVPSLIPAGRSWWWFVLVALGVAALLITAVVVVRWRRKKASRAQDDNVGLTSNPAVTQSPPPESSQRPADPEADVSYASISHAKTSSSEIRGRDEAVTYSTVKAPSSSAGASADPSNLYATIS